MALLPIAAILDVLRGQLARNPSVVVQAPPGAGKTTGIPLLLHLLSPAGRPAQITRDLGGFWENSYPDVRKALRGRYPKHHWPQDPLAARPTARARPPGD